MQTSGNSIHLREYFKILRSRFWVIFTIFLLTVISGAYVTEEVLPKIYSASTQIEIKPRNDLYVPTYDISTTDHPFDPTAFQAEFEIMQSSKVLSPVISDLELDKRWAKAIYKAPAISQQVALNYLNQLVHVDFKKGTDIVVITVSDEDPKEAAEIANAVAASYKHIRDNEESDRTNEGTDTIKAQIVDQQAIVDDRRAKMEQLRTKAYGHDVEISPGDDRTSQIDIELAKDKADLLAAKEDADSRRVFYEKVQGLPQEDFIDTLSAMGRVDQNIQTLRSEELSLRADQGKLLQMGYGENNPAVKANENDLATKDVQIKDLVAGQRQALALDLSMSESRVALLQKEVDSLSARSLAQQSSDLGPFREAEHEYQKQMAILDSYKIHLTQVIGDSTQMQSPVRMISAATPPDAPSKPNATINMAVSILAGLFLGVLIAFLVEYLDTSVKTMADAESLLGLPVLTVIPNKGGPMPLTPQSARLPHAEGYRILRAKLDLKVQNGIGPSLAMLSGGPGEGKSTTIYNLAVVCAQAGQSVILVDCDVRRPMVHRLTNVSNDKGLADYLRGEGDPLEFIQQTAMPNLHVLTAGEIAGEDIAGLHGDKIRNILDELKQRYDLVLVDSPPVLGISDGSIIAREIDYVILVIQHRRYPREISLRAKRAIEEVHGNCVGMVLNCVAIKSDDSYYYYSNYGTLPKDKNARKKRKSESHAKTNGTPVMANGSRKESLESEEF